MLGIYVLEWAIICMWLQRIPKMLCFLSSVSTLNQSIKCTRSILLTWKWKQQQIKQDKMQKREGLLSISGMDYIGFWCHGYKKLVLFSPAINVCAQHLETIRSKLQILCPVSRDHWIQGTALPSVHRPLGPSHSTFTQSPESTGFKPQLFCPASRDLWVQTSVLLPSLERS